MKYIVCEKPGHFQMKEKAAPTDYDATQAIVNIKTIGICGTDLHAFAGNQPFFEYPRILGHELSAEVAQIGSEVDHIKAGDKVVIMPYVTCGSCVACRSGKTNCCTSMNVLGVHTDGGMQQQFVISADLLTPANDLSHQQIATVEPLAIGAHAVRRANVSADDTVVVVGCGPIGLGIMHFAKERGATVIAIDRVRDRLTFAKDRFQVPHVLLDPEEDPVEKVAEITKGDMATKVFDATGNKKALEKGIDYLAHGGAYVLVGIVKDHLTFYHPKIQAKETSILCSRNATSEDFETVLGSLREDRFPTEAYITHQVRFDDMIDSFENWLNPKTGVIKAMVTFDQA